MIICLEQGADLHMAQLMPLPLTVSCFSKIQIGFTFLVPAYPGSSGRRAVKRMFVLFIYLFFLFINNVTRDDWQSLTFHNNVESYNIFNSKVLNCSVVAQHKV